MALTEDALSFRRQRRRNYYLNLAPKERRARVMLYNSRARAKRQKIPHEITKESILLLCVDYCPVFGFPLDYALRSDRTYQENSPSLDRIDNTKGYVKGNIAVISDKANRLKKDGNLHDIEDLYLWMKKHSLNMI